MRRFPHPHPRARARLILFLGMLTTLSPGWPAAAGEGVPVREDRRIENPVVASGADPVFTRTAEVFGPGHASFVKSRDDQEDWIVYHSAKHSGAGWNRRVNMQRFSWNPDGGIENINWAFTRGGPSFPPHEARASTPVIPEMAQQREANASEDSAQRGALALSDAAPCFTQPFQA